MLGKQLQYERDDTALKRRKFYHIIIGMNRAQSKTQKYALLTKS